LANSEPSQNRITKTDPTDARRNGNEPLRPDLTTRQVQRGTHQGDRYVRVIRSQMLRRVAPGILRATEAVSHPDGTLGHWYTRLKTFLVGKPLPTAAEKDERLNKVRALAVLSSDAISSSAYATEEILLVVILAGTAAVAYSVPVAMGIAVLLAIVAFSYRQTVHAYPQGGGAYNVSRENLGTPFGLVAAAALLVGYILTVAVSVAAGTAAITSAAPELYPYRVEISVGFVVLITLINLRGIKESSTIFALPTYLFIFSLTSVILLGLFRIALGEPQVAPRLAEGVSAVEPLSLFLLLRAFAAGTVAMTGTEAIANGVPVFKPPESKNAATTLTWMSAILAFFFVGLTYVAYHYGITPHETETVISQVAHRVLNNEMAYAFFQVTTMAILVLAANTSYFDFPRLAYVLANDGFMPHQLKFRGDRLVFANGIVTLGAVSILLIVLFGGSTHALIPLYAVGVFISFTLSQAGMVRHWWRTRTAGWRKSMVINAIGAALTAMVVLVVVIAKFALGAWIVLVLIPILVFLFYHVHRHYARVAEQLALAPGDDRALAPTRQIVIVPIGDLNKASLRALTFARSLAPQAIAVRIFYEPEEVETFRQEWARWCNGTQLVLLESPYRAFVEPLLAYIEELHRQDPAACVTIVLPEFVPAHWWEHFLHNQTALRLKTALLFRKNTVVIDVPYHLER
jgi:amino acid transporter